MHEADLLSDRVAFIDRGRIIALDTPHALKQEHGKRMLKAEIRTADGQLVEREIVMDRDATPQDVEKLFTNETVETLHSEEATLEDIFIKITGRELVG